MPDSSCSGHLNDYQHIVNQSSELVTIPTVNIYSHLPQSLPSRSQPHFSKLGIRAAESSISYLGASMQHDDGARGISDASTPSPAASMTTTPATSASSATRKPPRKSTLTQQQRNQKRQRATQDQLVTLEVEFGRNPTPTAAVRERIAQEINMTERSVQIWFQNR